MILSVFRRVFEKARYLFVVMGVAFTVVSAALLLPNKTALYQVISSGSIGFFAKASFVLSIFGSLKTNFTLVSATYLVIVAILFGINIAFLVFYIRRRQVSGHGKRAHLASVGGIVSSVLGIGCAACGSVVLTAVFGLVGAGGLLSWLPLHGFEFGIVGLGLLLFSIFYLAKKINDPMICPLES